MKVGITGHTSGIGEGFARWYQERGCEVRGFSRQNGFNLFDEMVLHRLLEQVDDLDLFINNAPCGFNQSRLLLLLFERWQHTSKKILNISSAEGDEERIPLNTQSYKRALNETVQGILAQPKTKCRVYNLKLGWVDTPRSLEARDPARPILSVHEVLQTAQWMLNQPPELHMAEVLILPKD